MAPEEVTEMDALLEKQLEETTGKKKTPFKREPKPEPEPEAEPEGAGNSPSGLPNPLGLDLTTCHLPDSMLIKEGLFNYVTQYWKQKDWSKVSPSPTESELFRKYLDLVRTKTRNDGRTNRPVDIRLFVAAVRSIAMGKHVRVTDDVHLTNFSL